MPQISEKITINRPVNAVFALAIDSSRLPQWQTDILSIYPPDERLRVGVMMTQNRDTYLLGWRLDLNADIVDYAPNRTLGYKGVLGRFPVQGRLEFEGHGGTCDVSETLNIRMGFPFGLFGFLLKSVMRRRTRNALEALKQLAESG
jgi:uncharacterized membrane protein